jgi:uncharacterized RDD family membrane protein YckC
MEFWLIEDGEKAGPYQDYTVRQRILSGELGPETKGWHRDQDGWRPLGEIEIFRGEFEKPVEVAGSALPPPLPQNSATWGGAIVRFLARWIDLLTYQALFLVLLHLTGANLMAVGTSPWFFVLFVLPLVGMEGVFLNRWGTTPGKWLGGVKLVATSGERVSTLAGILRAFRVFVMGLGMLMHPLLSLGCQAFALWFLLKKKCALWDLRAGIEIRISEFKPERMILLFLTAAILVGGNSVLAISALMEVSDQLPEPLRTEVEEFKTLWNETKNR